MTSLTLAETGKVLFRNAANLITAAGIIATFVLSAVFFLYPDCFGLMLALAIFIGLTDLLDGIIARRFNIQSYWGGAADRLRDKIFVCQTLIFLVIACKGVVYLMVITESLVIEIVILELLLFVEWMVCIKKKINAGGDKSGRVKMFIQFFAVCAWLLLAILQKNQNTSLPPIYAFLVNGLLVAALIFGIKSLFGHLQNHGIKA